MCLFIHLLTDISKEILKMLKFELGPTGGTASELFLPLPSEGPKSSLTHGGNAGSRHGGGNLLFPCHSAPSTAVLTPSAIHQVAPSSPKAHGNSSDLWTAQGPYCWEISTVKSAGGALGETASQPAS